MGTNTLNIVVGLATAVFPVVGGDCEGLAKLKLADTTIATAKSVAAGSFQPPAGGPMNDLPAFCRVAGVIKPSSDSDIKFEVWMPAEGWKSKFQGVGNGGFAGVISYGGLADAIRNGYAAASTDTGHQAGGTDATWGLKHPEKTVDFGHRAIHEMTVKGKAITEAFYGSSPKRSYFSSCSNGGRQALMEAQRYPADYDGIIAGAPANYWTHLLTSAMSNMKATAGDAAGYIPAAKLPAIQKAALSSCDANDGVSDGVIENPMRCRLDPSALLCKGDESDSCLTAPQVAALQKLYGGTRNAKGQLIFPGYSPGGEAEQGGWGPWITGQEREKSLMFAFGTNFFRNIVFSDPEWDYKTFDVDRDSDRAVGAAASALNATNPDLKAFKARGGKLILYHGWSDAAIPALNTIDYYDSVVQKDGRREGGGICAVIHGSGDAALRRRGGTKLVWTRRGGSRRPAAQRWRSVGAVGGEGCRPNRDHRGQIQGFQCRERSRPHPAAMHLSQGGAIQGFGQHGRCREL